MSDENGHRAYHRLSEFLDGAWPSFLPVPDDMGLLDEIWIEAFNVEEDGEDTVLSTSIWIDRQLELSIPGLDAVALAIAPGHGGTVVPIEAVLSPEFQLKLAGVPLVMRLRSDLLVPAIAITDEDGTRYVPDPDRSELDIVLGRVSIAITADGDISLELDRAMSLPVCLIGSTGVAVEADGIELCLDADNPPPGRPAGWRGLYLREAAVHLPAELAGTAGSLAATDCYIGNGGFSGRVSASWSSPLVASVGGVDLGLTGVELEFIQNVPVQSDIAGLLTVPFFDEPVAVAVGLGLDGSFTVALAADNAVIERENVVRVSVSSLGLERIDGIMAVRLAGQLKPLVAGIDWPGFSVRELVIKSDGTVDIDGGWFDLPEQYALDLYGFKLEATRLGMGRTDDGGNWIGINGGLALVEGLPAGATVEGLRITWHRDRPGPPTLTCNGVGVELEVPGAFQFKGTVAFRELETPVGIVRRFDGDIKLELTALELAIDATLVLGTAPAADGGRYTFMAVYIGTELPAGIPLFSTGLAIYGMAGLFALRMIPGRRADQEWYEDWYKLPQPGVTDVKNKWDAHPDGLALGAGLTLGTLADNGYAFSGRFLLVIAFPGPVIMIEGRANVLKARASLAEDPLFRSLFVLDAGAGRIEVGMAAQYKYGDGGQLVDISAAAGAMFDLNDARNWYLNIGEREPRDRRVRAEVLSLFRADTYLMLSPGTLAFGAWAGYDEAWKLGPLAVRLEAWISFDVGLSMRPPQLTGDIQLRGMIALEAFGVGARVGADALIAATVFEPFHLLARLTLELGLPWPLPDIEKTLTLEWGPRVVAPPLPLPLQEVAVEHFKSTAAWPLPRRRWLLPDYHRDGDGYRQSPDRDPAVVAAAPPPADAPVVPVDCRPHLTFSRTVHDDAAVGVNARAVVPPHELVGEAGNEERAVARIEYKLTELQLDRWDPGAERWQPVAGTTGSEGERIFGSWAHQDPDVRESGCGQTKLWLWSLTPFDYTRHGGRRYDEWFREAHPDYPCPDPDARVRVCYDFGVWEEEMVLTSPWRHPGEHGPVLHWTHPSAVPVTELNPAINGYGMGICVPARYRDVDGSYRENELVIELGHQPRTVLEVAIYARDLKGYAVEAIMADGRSRMVHSDGRTAVTITEEDIVRIVVRGGDVTCLAAICIETGLTARERADTERLLDHMIEELERWSGTGAVLLPGTDYRLEIVTTIKRTGLGEYRQFNREETQKEYAFFRTGQPPGLGDLSIPAGHPEPDEFDSGLTDLQRYVEQTLPATVPPPGQLAVRPRPVYGASDPGVTFNEDYVDLMYMLAGRDLGLQLMDENGRIARDVSGRTLVLDHSWLDERRTLTAAQSLTREVYDAASCLTSNVVEARGLTLAPLNDTVLAPLTEYEARLVPRLIRDDFDRGLDRWQIVGQVGSDEPDWRTMEGPSGPYVTELSGIGSDDGPGAILCPGTLLVRGEPDWTDYRLSVRIGLESGGRAAGVAFRYQDASTYYRFSLDAGDGTRRLIRMVNGTALVLYEDEMPLVPGDDCLVTVEAVGPDLRVEVDGEAVAVVRDDAIESGAIALYCWRHPGAKFYGVRLDDLSAAAPVPYRFRFETSAYGSPRHHLHGFNDETWLLPVPAGSTAVAGAVAAAADPDLIPGEEEGRAYDLFAAAASLSPVRPEQVEVQRVDGGDSRGLLIRGPEPLDWFRTTVRAARTETGLSLFTPPGQGKLIGTDPGEECVSLVTRETMSLDRYRLDYLAWPGPLAPDRSRELLADDFGTDGGMVYRERFGPDALIRYRGFGGGTWRSVADHIACTATAEAGLLLRRSVGKRFRVSLNLVAQGRAGIVFGSSGDRYFRLVTGRSLCILERVEDGAVSRLWSGSVDGTARHRRLEIQVYDGSVSGMCDGLPLFLVDCDDPTGEVGVWCNTDFRMDQFTVEILTGQPVSSPTASELETETGEDPVSREPFKPDPREPFKPDLGGRLDLLRDRLAPFRDWLDPVGGKLPVPDFKPVPVTYRVSGDEWSDAAVQGRVAGAGSGWAGVVARYTDPDNTYRFACDGDGRCRLVSVSEGRVRVLWTGSVTADKHLSVTVGLAVVGDQLQGYVNGRSVCTVVDNTHSRGRAGTAVVGKWKCGELMIASLTRPVGNFTAVGPAQWWITGGLLRCGAIGTPAESWIVGGGEYGDVRVRADLCGRGPVGLVLRYRDRSNHYRLTMDGQRLVLARRLAGANRELWSGTDPVPRSRRRTVVVDVAGDRLTGYVNGQRLFSVVDGSHRQGRVGVCGEDALWCWSLAVDEPPLKETALLTGVFESLKLVPPAGWQLDRPRPPGQPAVVSKSDWDDAVVSALVTGGAAAALAVRWRDADNHYRLQLDSTRQRLIRRLRGEDRTLWEVATPAVRDVKVVCRGSELSVFCDGIPAAVVEDGELARGRVAVMGGRMTVRVFDINAAWDEWLVNRTFRSVKLPPVRLDPPGFDPGGLVPVRGTLVGGTDWRDYRVIAGFRAGAAAAVEVRSSSTGGYRLTLDARRLQLVRTGKQGERVLWTGAVRLVPGRHYTLVIDCRGPSITVWLDGIRRARVIDGELTAGGVRLIDGGKGGFTVLKVASGAWAPWYRFRFEPVLAAGTLVSVRGTPAADDPVPGEEHRLVSPGSGGGLIERGDLSELRLVDAAGREVHRRRFAAEGDWEPVAVRVCRSRDGTGWLVVPDSGAGLAPGDYRLEFTYRRDITDRDESSQVYTRGGHAGDEVVTLEVPWQPPV